MKNRNNHLGVRAPALGGSMTSRDFCYWLQGYFELGNSIGAMISNEQAITIRNHLAMVFKHEIDPSFGDKDKQELLNKLHDNGLIKPGDSSVQFRC